MCFLGRSKLWSLVLACVAWAWMGGCLLAASSEEKNPDGSENCGFFKDECGCSIPVGERLDLDDPAVKMRIRYHVETLEYNEPIVLASGAKVFARVCDADSYYVWCYRDARSHGEGPDVECDEVPCRVPAGAVRPKRVHKYSHKPVREPVLSSGSGEPMAAFRQVHRGDSALMAALTALRERDPTGLRQMFMDEGDTCLVRLYRPAPDTGELVPMHLRTRKSLVAKRAGMDSHARGALYAALLEKVFIDLLPYYLELRDAPSYHRLKGVMASGIALSALTGKAVDYLNLETDPSTERHQHGLMLIRHALAGGELVLARSTSTSSLLAPKHTFAVIAVDDRGREAYITVSNPLGDLPPCTGMCFSCFLGGGEKRGLTYRSKFWSAQEWPCSTRKALSRIKAKDFFANFAEISWTKGYQSKDPSANPR